VKRETGKETSVRSVLKEEALCAEYYVREQREWGEEAAAGRGRVAEGR